MQSLRSATWRHPSFSARQSDNVRSLLLGALADRGGTRAGAAEEIRSHGVRPVSAAPPTFLRWVSIPAQTGCMGSSDY